MKKIVGLSSLMLVCIFFAIHSNAQDQQNNQNSEEIIIRKKGDFPEKLTIQLNGNKVLINGKKPEDIKGNIEVIRKKSSGDDAESYGFDQSESPFDKGGAQGFGFSGSPFGNPDHNRALLGVLTMPADSADGAKVAQVEKGSPADSAGIQNGDIITRINQDDIHSAQDLSSEIGKFSPGTVVTVTYTRNGETNKTDVKLGQNDNVRRHFAMTMPYDQFHFPGQFGNNPDMQNFLRQFRENHPFMGPDMSNSNSPRLGMTIENRDNGKGVNVIRVMPGSNAAKSGIQPGDVLTEFGGKKVNSVDDVITALHNHSNDKEVEATIIRDKKTHKLTIQISNNHQQATL